MAGCQHVRVSPCGCQWVSLCVPCVSALLSVSLVCLVVEVWVGKFLCVSRPWGWRAEQLQVATRKSKQVRVGGCGAGRGWMKASEYTEEGQGVGQRGAEQAEGEWVGRRRKTRGVREVGVLLVSPPALTGPDCLLNLVPPAAGSELTLHRGRGWRGRGGEQSEAWARVAGGWWRGSGSWDSIAAPSWSPEPITARLTFSWLLQC